MLFMSKSSKYRTSLHSFFRGEVRRVLDAASLLAGWWDGCNCWGGGQGTFWKAWFRSVLAIGDGFRVNVPGWSLAVPAAALHSKARLLWN